MIFALLTAVPDYGEYQPDGGMAALFGGAMMIIWLIIGVLTIAGLWKVFTKAGEPGWAAIIPIYNMIVMLKIAGRPLWWFILLLIPFINLIVAIIVMIDIAKAFGKGVGYGIGLAILPFIFFPALGFGSATYRGASA